VAAAARLLRDLPTLNHGEQHVLHPARLVGLDKGDAGDCEGRSKAAGVARALATHVALWPRVSTPMRAQTPVAPPPRCVSGAKRGE
jgi:hypothetical protein